jgi:hypothetical protein
MSQPEITRSHSLFSLACRVDIAIDAGASTIWTLLTDAPGFPRWSSTIKRLDGQIRDGKRLTLHVPGTDRTFKPLITIDTPGERMTWTGGFLPLFKGVRTFVLSPRSDASTDFSMEERFSGLMIPLAARSMPDFGPVFAGFANDLKREAERVG